MIPFQYAGILVCLVFAGWNGRRLYRGQRPGWLALLGTAAGVAGAVAIFDPDITTRIARAVGIGRGADLVSYVVAVAFLISWFYFYQRTRTLSIAVTALVRELAIRDARPPASPAHGAGDAGEARPRGAHGSESGGE
jgi:hypothetical protein